MRPSSPRPSTGLSARRPTRRPLLATAGSDGTVNLWRISDGAHEGRLTASGGSLEAVAFAPDDSALIAAGREHFIYVWETTPDGRYVLHRVFRSLSPLWAAEFVDQTTIITGEHGGLVRRWNFLRSPDRYRIPHLAFSLPHFAFSPNNKSLVTAAWDLRVFNLAAQTEVAQPAPPTTK